MFDVSNGLFQFVFANQDDEYYTESLLRLQFLPYLRYQLFRDGFRYVYSFGKETQSSKKEFWMQCVGSMSIDVFEAGQKKKGWFPKNDKREEGFAGGDIARMELYEQELPAYFLQVLEILRQYGQTAVVIPIRLFVRFSYDERIHGALEELVRRSKTNAIILTGSVRAEDNDPFFVSPVNVFPNDSSKKPSDCIFYNQKVFPQIRTAFSAESGTLSKLVPTYRRLNAAFRGRVFFLNNLPYPRMKAAVQYAMLRLNANVPPDMAGAIAAVLLAWYKNPDFRNKYYQLNLESNTMGLMRVVTKQLSPALLEKLADVAKAENIEDIDIFFGRYPVDTDAPMMIAPQQGQPAIMRLLLRYRMLLRGHEEVLSKAEYFDLDRFVSIFGAPSYTSSYLHTPLPHERFMENEVQMFLSDAFDALRDQPQWTTWDAAMMYILYRLFWCCAKEAEAPCVEDPYNQIGERRFEKAFDAMRHCRYMAQIDPTAMEPAIKFGNEVSSLLKNGSKEQLISYIIPRR